MSIDENNSLLGNSVNFRSGDFYLKILNFLRNLVKFTTIMKTKISQVFVHKLIEICQTSLDRMNVFKQNEHFEKFCKHVIVCTY